MSSDEIEVRLMVFYASVVGDSFRFFIGLSTTKLTMKGLLYLLKHLKRMNHFVALGKYRHFWKKYFQAYGDSFIDLSTTKLVMKGLLRF